MQGDGDSLDIECLETSSKVANAESAFENRMEIHVKEFNKITRISNKKTYYPGADDSEKKGKQKSH